MNAALASLFTTPTKSPLPTYEENSNKQIVFHAMQRLNQPCCIADLTHATGLNSNQVQYALRHMRDHRQISLKQTPRGAGHVFQYYIPVNRMHGTILDRIIAAIVKHGTPMAASDIAVAIGVSEKSARTTVAHALKNNIAPGFSRVREDGRYLYWYGA